MLTKFSGPRLGASVSIVVPSTIDVSKSVSQGTIDTVLQTVCRQWSAMFGAFTVTDSDGGWVCGTGELVNEPVRLVTSYASPDCIRQHENAIHDMASHINTVLNQKCVAVIFTGLTKNENGLHLVYQR